MKGELHRNPTALLQLSTSSCFGTSMKKSKKQTDRKVSLWEIYSRTFNQYTQLIHSRDSHRKILLMAIQQQNEEQNLHFLSLSLLPFLSDAAFHDCLETRRHLEKKNKTHIIRILMQGTYAERSIATTVNYYSLIIIMAFVLENTHHPT